MKKLPNANLIGNFKNLYSGEGNLKGVTLWGIGVYGENKNGLIRLHLPNQKSVFVGDMLLQDIFKKYNFTTDEQKVVEAAIKLAA